MKWHIGQLVVIDEKSIAMVTRVTDTLVCVMPPCSRFTHPGLSDAVHAAACTEEMRFTKDGLRFGSQAFGGSIQPVPCEAARTLWAMVELSAGLSLGLNIGPSLD